MWSGVAKFTENLVRVRRVVGGVTISVGVVGLSLGLKRCGGRVAVERIWNLIGMFVTCF